MRLWFRCMPLALLAALLSACASPASRIPSSSPTRIVSEPSLARVYIDDRFAGETPLELNLQRRTHTIRIEKEGYAPVSGYLTVVHRQSEDLVDSGFAWWWIFADDEKYQFRESYSYQLKPLVTADQVQ